jgi:hypothetical protein
MTAQQGRPPTIQAHYRQAGSRGLGDHQRSILMKARKEKDIGLLTHPARELRSTDPSSELGSVQQAPALRETRRRVSSGPAPQMMSCHSGRSSSAFSARNTPFRRRSLPARGASADHNYVRGRASRFEGRALGNSSSCPSTSSGSSLSTRDSWPTPTQRASRKPRERIEVPGNRPRDSPYELIRNATGPEGG